ncbi:hypothetical protein P0136_08575 [Lentisphaerota bacterium ZTH]|nr:hypothetical protein JYG24_00320 [Lentisphaerota bacterium]WET05419.1 hypothetical protein P0136_08575 [Lentisphaerota bacterium ZTH]
MIKCPIKKFTLVELLVAMAIFMILSMVIMQFFNSASKVWSNTEKRNQVYADARIVMNLISNDLQAMMYNNQDSTEGIFPIWYEDRPIKAFESVAGDYNTLSAVQKKIYSRDNVNQISFAARTDVRDDQDKSLALCEIRYTFLPANMVASKQWCLGKNSAGGVVLTKAGQAERGLLIRSCTTNHIEDAGNLGSYISNPRYNLNDFPYNGADALRINKVFDDINGAGNAFLRDYGNPSFSPYVVMIEGVLDLKIIPRIWDGSTNEFKAVKAIAQNDGALSSPFSSVTYWNFTSPVNRLTGIPLPDCITIELELMNKKDFKMWRQYIIDGKNSEAETIRNKKARKFSKTVFLQASMEE